MAIARIGDVDLTLAAYAPTLDSAPFEMYGVEQDFQPSWASSSLTTIAPDVSAPKTGVDDMIINRLFGPKTSAAPSSPSPAPAPVATASRSYGATAPTSSTTSKVPWTMVAAGVGALALVGVVAFKLKKKKRR